LISFKAFDLNSSRQFRHGVLTGITKTAGERYALINNEIVKVGDLLAGNALVKSIFARDVILEYQGKDISLTLN